jgi:tryptophan synthase alpha chain
MTYVNPVLAYGVRRFARDAAQTGVSGVIIPDLPVEEAADISTELRAAGLATVFLVAPTSSDRRIGAACAASTGFVYCVTITGITGSRAELPDGVAALLLKVRRQTELPVAAGFGISRPEQITGLKGHADAVVVGSAIVDELDRGRDAGELVRELLAACR